MIRSLGPSDRDELVRMRQALWPDSTEADVDSLLEERPSVALVLVSDRGDAGLCGFAELGTRRYAEGCMTSPVASLISF